VEVFGIADDLPNGEAAARLRAERRHRVPVYGDTPDDIVGILDARRFLSRLSLAEQEGRAPDAIAHYSEELDPPSFVSETMRAPDLLRGFLGRRQGLAVVLDEYGGTEGIVTLADLIEEITGDALPSGADDLYIEPLDDDRLLASGHARLDDLSEYPGFELHAEGLDTISGLIFNRLGYLPAAGSVLRLPPALTLTIRRVTRKTITEVLIEKDPSGSAGDTANLDAN
jgi:putative hemolysin